MVYESFNWQHGVFVGAAMRSEATAAAEHKGEELFRVISIFNDKLLRCSKAWGSFFEVDFFPSR